MQGVAKEEQRQYKRNEQTSYSAVEWIVGVGELQSTTTTTTEQQGKIIHRP